MQENGLSNLSFMMPNKIIRSKRKTLSLTINENAELIIRAPKRLSIEKIQDFIKNCKKRGVDLKWFGDKDPIAYTSRYDSWKYIENI